jgi:hypothetical protein
MCSEKYETANATIRAASKATCGFGMAESLRLFRP